METDYNKLWEGILTNLELSISKANFGTWFKNTAIHKLEDDIVYLSVPNTFVRDWLINKYHKLILKSLRDSSLSIRNLKYVIVKNENKNKTQPKENLIKENYNEDLGLNDLYINREDNLNPKYTFDSFIVGSFNDVAYAASQAIIKNPGMNYNPLFIYGGTGVGKTHLIQAIGNKIKKNNEYKKVYYIISENFGMDLISSIQNNRVNQFKEKYRKYDVLIMDDVQFFSKKEKFQEELFHLFNNFYENNKQIIFSSDKPPKYIDNLEERLRSRFEGGMIVDIGKPDYETRLAIIKTKIKNLDLLISEDVLEYIASVIQDNVRELEGALNSIIVQSQTKKRILNLNEVKILIKNNIKPQKQILIKDIMKIVSGYYNIEEKFLYEKTRRKEVVKPRQIIMYLLREDFSTSYPYIGQKLGGRDHTTVIHAYEKIKNEIKQNPVLNQELEQIRTLLYNPV